MNFKPRTKEEPEINLIPFIDVLLVVLIFLMLTTTYNKFTELQLKLPVANGESQRDYPREIIVAVASDGRYLVNKAPVSGQGVDAVTQALRQATAAAPSSKEPVVVISADASASHQAVITVMEAARRSGLQQVTFATRATAQDGG